MNTNSGKVVHVTAGIIAFMGAATILLLYLLDGNIGGKLLYQAIASGVFCVCLIYTILVDSKKLVQQPLSSYIIISYYLIVCLLLCFPNRFFDAFALIYLISIPVAVFYGFRYAVVTIAAVVVMLLLSGSYGALEILHIIYALITCAVASGTKDKGMDIMSGITAILLQGIVLLISRRTMIPDTSSIWIEIVVIVINALTIPGTYRLLQLKEQIPEVVQPSEFEEEHSDFVLETVTQSMIADKDPEPEPEEKIQVIDYSHYPLDIVQLICDECEVLKAMKSCAPRAIERAMEIATFARKISYKFGANSDLVYAAALYHDVDRIYKEAPGAEIVLPEYLYKIVKRQNEKELPASVEELIVLLSNHVLAIYHYMEKNNSTISISKVTENIFALQLKKGSIMSAGISMSVYHKMKKEFINEFMIYLEQKTIKNENARMEE